MLTAVAAAVLAWVAVRVPVPHGYWAVLTMCLVLGGTATETRRAARHRAPPVLDAEP